MASNNPFLIAHYEKTVLTQQTSKRIQLIYKQSAKDIEKKLRNLQMLTPSDSLKKVYFENLLKDINKSSESFNRLIQSTVMSAGESAGNIAVEAGNRFMKGAGLSIQGAYSYIPRQQVLNIASGKLYGDKWTLSSAIWKNGLRTKSDIQNVVAKGLVQNKPIKDIADDLMKYVDPTARKPWDWSKVYPGTATKVDYNAQRLARTMIQHSFQASLVQSQRYNPFCKGVIWHSVGLHGRTCELCLERDGNVFPVKDLPLDHPNGLCYFEPALDSMNDVADRLADWVNGGSDLALDTYVAKAFNMNPKSPAGKKAVEAVKGASSKASRMTRAQKQKFIDENLTQLQRKVLNFGSNPRTAKKNWEAIEQKLLGLSDEQLRLLSRTEGRYSVLTSKGAQAYYSEIDRLLVMPLNSIVKKDDWFTFFHELGHVIDTGSYKYMSKLKGIEKYAARTERDIEYSKKLFSLLENDYKKLLNVDGTLKDSVVSDLLGVNVNHIDQTAGVQDIISGLSADNNRLWYGHDSKYWGKPGGASHRAQVNSEAVANMFAAWVDPEAEKYMKKYFPKAYKYWLSEMKKGVKKNNG